MGSVRPTSFPGKTRPLALSFCQQLDGLNLEQASASQAPPPEQPAMTARSSFRRALAVVEGCGHRYSKNLRPAPTPTIAQERLMPTSRNITVSPFENLAAAQIPLITMSCTSAVANDR